MPVDALGQMHARAEHGVRIVSLVPSITELLFALGLGERVGELTLRTISAAASRRSRRSALASATASFIASETEVRRL